MLFLCAKALYTEGRERNRSNQVPFPPLDQSVIGHQFCVKPPRSCRLRRGRIMKV